MANRQVVADGAEQPACAGYMKISSTGRARMAAAESCCWLLLIGRVIKPRASETSLRRRSLK
ncbi:hypothetical protein EIQ01_10055 [Xanthomonas campestris pv. raphani]